MEVRNSGDFVYGNLNELPDEAKKMRYDEFKTFDRKCRDEGVLFLKLLFVTNRDSIARTLGKRLAQKMMATDLMSWQRACSSRSGGGAADLEGLEAVSAHIDPTDFVAFNDYTRNLRIFSNFALNTDCPDNPWVVVNTGDRFAARKALMQNFRSHLRNFEKRGEEKGEASEQSRVVGIDEMMKTTFARSWRHSLLAWLTLMGLLLLAFIYADNTKW